MIKPQHELLEVLIEIAKLGAKLDAIEEKLDAIEPLEKRITAIESFQSYVRGAAIGAAAIFSVGMSFGIEAIKRLFL